MFIFAALTVPVAADTWPTLKKDSAAKNEVYALQYLLNHWNYGPTLVVDGSFGPNTLTAVKNFQTKKKLTADGIVGTGTWTALTNFNQSTSNYSGKATKALQYLLKNKYSIPALTVDGSFGPATKDAVLAFQKKFGLSKDGVVGPNTWKKLVSTSAQAVINWGGFNCKGYAFGATKFLYEKDSPGVTVTPCSKNATLKSGEYLIAYRYTASTDHSKSTWDFHYWKKDPRTGYWWDKHGTSPVEFLGSANPDADSNWLRSPGNYDSPTAYYKVTGTFWAFPY